jgi:hypothetical protein
VSRGPRPLPREICAHCGRQTRCVAVILNDEVCHRCTQRFRYRPAACPGCGEPKVLAYYDTSGQPACAGCTGAESIYACPRCGREDQPYGRYCGRCTLHERASELLRDESGRIHPRLQPVFDTLLAGPRPQTTLGWFQRSDGPPVLRRMARGELAISHATFTELPSNKTINYLRDLLTATGVLPGYDPPVERITPWLNEILAGLPRTQADPIERFARWHVLRKLRTATRTGTATQKGAEHARAVILAAVRLTNWLAQHELDLATMRQGDLEQYLHAYPRRAAPITTFLRWADSTGASTAVAVPRQPTALPKITVSDEDRWRHVEQLLHDNTLRTYVRVAGLLTLLFAQPLARICRMRADQVTVHPDGRVTLTFDTLAIEAPEPLDQLLLEQLANRGQASYVSRGGTWLFPGGIPGRHLVTENIRSQLVERGIQPSSARNAAMFALAAEVPTPILADILGLGTNTAARWATLAARDWSQYTAARRE